MSTANQKPRWYPMECYRSPSELVTIPVVCPPEESFYVVGDVSFPPPSLLAVLPNFGYGYCRKWYGKIDVGTVDPPYTIWRKIRHLHVRYDWGKEEVTGTLTTNEYLEGVGFKTINLDQLPKGSDLWLFSKTTNLNKPFVSRFS